MRLLILLLLIFGIYSDFYVIIQVGGVIGAAATLFAMGATAMVGLWLVRIQGLGVYRKMNAAMAKNEPPVKEMMHGFLLLVAGFLLIIPGFISDIAGALLLLPPIRTLLISFGIGKQTKSFFTWRQQTGDGQVIIEGEYKKEDENGEDRPSIGKAE